MDYIPRPVDTSHVSLTDDVRQLIECLARNNHEHWARLRFAEGWRYGAQRDDIRKEHPDLAPYDDLSEGEKEYDRTTAIETLKTIIALGYRVARSSQEEPRPFVGR